MDHVYEIKSIKDEMEFIERKLKDRILISSRIDQAPFKKAFTGDYVYFLHEGKIIASVKITSVNYFEEKDKKKLQFLLKRDFEKVVFEKDYKRALEKDRYHTLLIVGEYHIINESDYCQSVHRWEVIGDIKRI